MSNMWKVEGRTWVFPDNINTDLIMPHAAFTLPQPEQLKLVFSANRPGWSGLVKAGDIIVGGKNFGTGSSRPGAMLLKALGITAIIAESINGLFFRNCINTALPAMECAGVSRMVVEGDILCINFLEGTVVNSSNQKMLSGTKIPADLMEIIESGGILSQLVRGGYIK